MENDKKELQRRYAELTTSELIELRRSPRVSVADAAIIDEMLEFRGVSKTARDNLKNTSIAMSSAPVGAIDTFSYKEFSARPWPIVLIAIFSLWEAVSDISHMVDAQKIDSALYFFAFAVLNVCLAFSLWELKKWARSYLIFFYSLKISLLWLIVLSLYSLDDNSRLALADIAQSILFKKISLSDHMKAVMFQLFLKFLFIAVLLKSAIYGALIAYFFKPSVRRLFE